MDTDIGPMSVRMRPLQRCAKVVGILLIIIILANKFGEELYYIYNPYVDEKCAQKESYEDVYVDKSIKNRTGMFTTNSSASGRPFECPTKSCNQTFKWEDYMSNNKMIVSDGGCHSPSDCKASTKVAIIVPYRDRSYQLSVFSSAIHKFLVCQNIEYRLFVIEQADQNIFNRGALLNAGYKTVKRVGDFDCIVFHDVDSLPMHLLNRYDCPTSPRHMKFVNADNTYYSSYSMFTGGVTSLKAEHFELVNGFSNLYWGWGMEDDDLFYRLRKKDLHMVRPALCLGYYLSMTKEHKAQYSYSFNRFLVYLTGVVRMNIDGLNSVKYRMVGMETRPYYTMISIAILKRGKSEEHFSLFNTIPLIYSYIFLVLLLRKIYLYRSERSKQYLP